MQVVALNLKIHVHLYTSKQRHLLKLSIFVCRELGIGLEKQTQNLKIWRFILFKLSKKLKLGKK